MILKVTIELVSTKMIEDMPIRNLQEIFEAENYRPRHKVEFHGIGET